MKRITICYHQDAERWWADSADIPGWTAAGQSLEEVRQQAEEGTRVFAGDGVEVTEEGLPSEPGAAAQG